MDNVIRIRFFNTFETERKLGSIELLTKKYFDRYKEDSIFDTELGIVVNCHLHSSTLKEWLKENLGIEGKGLNGFLIYDLDEETVATLILKSEYVDEDL